MFIDSVHLSSVVLLYYFFMLLQKEYANIVTILIQSSYTYTFNVEKHFAISINN